MKVSHIIAIVLVAVCIAIIYSTLTQAGTYDVFRTAAANPDKEYHIIGKYNREKEVIYDPVKDPDMTVFYLTDTAGTEMKVVLHEEKPADFERSERVVVIGKSSKGEFHAKKILMKCPSKYNTSKAGSEQSYLESN